ncbi:MAG: hypothetical protein QM764_23675 [Chitinophagaceae bacterium]
MATKKIDFAEVLKKIESIVSGMGFMIQYTQNMDPFFKGDLDGKTIFIGTHLSAEEKVFNLLHLAGHSIQWNVDELLRTLGSELYRNPDDALLLRLQTYEWQANCYALTILHQAKQFNLDKWLTRKYIIDMLYLTHFYKTGEKLKRITQAAKAYPFRRELEPKEIPSFTPRASEKTRNGIVIAF